MPNFLTRLTQKFNKFSKELSFSTLLNDLVVEISSNQIREMDRLTSTQSRLSRLEDRVLQVEASCKDCRSAFPTQRR